MKLVGTKNNHTLNTYIAMVNQCNHSILNVFKPRHNKMDGVSEEGCNSEYRPCCLSSWMLSVALLCFRMVTSDSKLVEVIFPHKFRGKLERRDTDKEKSPSPTNSNWPRKGRFILKLRKTCATCLPNVNFYFHFLFWILLSRTLIWIIKMYVEQSTTKRIFIYNCRQLAFWVCGRCRCSSLSHVNINCNQHTYITMLLTCI